MRRFRLMDATHSVSGASRHRPRALPRAPSASFDSERLHQVTKMFRTKQRNGLLYVTNHALSFAKLEMMHDASGAAAGLKWPELRAIHQKMNVVSDTEEIWAAQQDQRWRDEDQQVETEEAEETSETAEADVAEAPSTEQPEETPI